MQKILILLFTVLMLFGCLHSEQKEQLVTEDIKEAYYAALLLKGKEDFTGAEKALKKIIEKDEKFYLAYRSLVEVYADKKDLDGAVDYFEELEEGENPYPTWALGLVYDRKELYDKAIDYHKGSIEIEKNFYGPYTGLVDVCLKKAKNNDNILAELEKYLNILVEMEPSDAGPHYGLGYLFFKQYKYDKALVELDKIELNSTLQLQMAYLKSKIYLRKGDHDKLIEHCNQSLLLYRKIGDKKNEGNILNVLGIAYRRTSFYSKSLEYYKKAQAIQNEIGDKKSKGLTLNNIGVVYQHLSKYSEGLEYYDKALMVARDIGNIQIEAYAINNIAIIYDILSDHKKSLAYKKKALSISIEIGEKINEAILNNNIGLSYMNLSKNSDALEYYKKSLSIYQVAEYKNGEAGTLHNLGIVNTLLSEYPKALDYYQKALSIYSEIGNKQLESEVLNNIGQLYFILADYQMALEYFNKAYSINKEIGHKRSQSQSFIKIGQTYLALKDYTQALSNFKEAIIITESIRGDFKSNDLKTGFFQYFSELYQDLITCLYELHKQNPSNGYDKQAFTYAEKSKARGLLDLLAESKADIRQGIDPELREQERNLEREYARLNTSLQQELSKSDDAINKEEVTSLKTDLKKVEDRFDQLKLQIIRKNPRYAQVKYPESVTIEEIQKTILDDETIMLEYKVTKDALFAWRITKDEYTFSKLNITEEELTNKIVKLRNCFSNTPLSLQDYAPVCHELYTLLLEPLLIETEKKKLLIIPDGILHYLPFETLANITPGNNVHIKEETYEELTDKDIPFLIKDYTITYAQSAGVACNITKDRKRMSWRNDLFAMGDPVFSDEENSGVGLYTRSALPVGEGDTKRDGLARLVYSGEEVENIAGLFRKADVYLRKEATEERIKEPGVLKNYRYVHLAAHSILNENKPQFSGIILTQDDDPAEDGYLQTREIFNIELNADLVVLSACQTGLGKQVSGEGFVGMTRAWMYAGTPSVAVSLWPVEDKSTGLLMEYFYSNIKKGMTHSDALRQAKLALMESGDEYNHPVYWAGFILLGGNK